MQMLLTKHVLDRVLVPNPPWSFEQAEQYCQYFLRCWHMNETFRSAWIDGGRLHLGDDVIPSTGGQERHHRDIDEHAFKCQLNRDVTSVAMAVSGMDCNGSLTKGILSTAEQEYEREKSMGQQRPPSMDISRRVTEAKACLELLLNGDSSYERRPGFCEFVRSFDKDMIRRRAEPGAMSQSPFPAVLQHLRESLAYGGRDSFQRVGWNALNAQDACECLSATYHGARSAWGKCKHARYRSWCLRVHAAPDAAAVEVVYQEAEASLRQLIWGREKSRPQAVRCWELYDAANPKGGASRADLLAAMAVHPSLPPTGKGTGLTEVDEAELLWREVDEEEEEERTCEFGSVHDLGVVFSHSPSVWRAGGARICDAGERRARACDARWQPPYARGANRGSDDQLRGAGDPAFGRGGAVRAGRGAVAAALPAATACTGGGCGGGTRSDRGKLRPQRSASRQVLLRLRLPGQWPQEAAWARAWRCARQARQEAAVVTCRESPDR